MEKTQMLLDELREQKRVKGLSYQEIADITEKNGEAVSVSTVKRVFAHGADIEEFRFQSSILPIARAVLDSVDEEPPETVVSTVTKLKNEQIEIYRRQIIRLMQSERRYRLWAIIVTCILAILLGADFALGNFGWIRY